MDLVSPGIGLIFWMTIVFALLIFLLGKYAWKPILKALREREDFIEKSLHAADKAREEMKELKFSNEELLKEAKEERDSILREARKIRENILEESRIKANEEADRIVENAKVRIDNEKKAAMISLKNEIASLSIEIAEKILEQELSGKLRQKEYIEKLMDQTRLN